MELLLQDFYLKEELSLKLTRYICGYAFAVPSCLQDSKALDLYIRGFQQCFENEFRIKPIAFMSINVYSAMSELQRF